MAKTVSLDDLAHAKLVALAGRLTTLAMKPVPLGIAIHFAVGAAETMFEQTSEESKEKLGAYFREIDFREIEKGFEEIYRQIMRGASAE